MCTVRDIVDFRKWVTGHFRQMIKNDVIDAMAEGSAGKPTAIKAPHETLYGGDHLNGNDPPLPGQNPEVVEIGARKMESKDVLS